MIEYDNTKTKKEIIVVGGFSEVFELCELCGYVVYGYVDIEDTYPQYKYLGNDDFVLSNSDAFIKYPIIISPDNPHVRKKLIQRYKERGFQLENLISPNAYISPSSIIGEGCMIQSFCNVSSNTRLGDGVRLNTYSNIMHDVIIDNYSIVAPNAVLLGRCSIGAESYIGANATILPDINVGSECIIGAASVVTKDVENGSKVCGNPARSM